ncbi:alpha-L-fucosidase [Streptomyces katsurahamanus]|uniref:alpha-L-fucosidase n=1 Tax=Streptomyces katsurahamanus TaxID=2577098 RepID=A0ABW9NPE5_9ACTN|nr:alpha-L-fucosidase [Streptomyces katsurahamanus]MQS35167.1 alpha-L-fucosidase [Streptomyces katsurahamanus]
MRHPARLALWTAVLALLGGLLLAAPAAAGPGAAPGHRNPGTAQTADRTETPQITDRTPQTADRTGTAQAAHPARQDMLRSATAGLFLHWGMFTRPLHTDCRAWERAVTEGGWSADYWVDEARKLRASYIVLATFHSRLGYARPWPSKIPGSCATERDILGELITAARAKGIEVILYMTDDPKWHSEQGFNTLDSAAYSAYKGREIDLTTRPGFGEYSYDLFFEVMAGYPKLSGFWIDNDNEYWEQNRLYEQIREIRPDLTLSNNNEDTAIMDMVSHEQKTGMTPGYDQPSAIWTPMPRLTESCYKVPDTGSWWYDGQDRQVSTGLNVGRYVANAGTSIKSLMNLTAMTNGRFPPRQQQFTDFMEDYLPPIWKSLSGVHGGGYMHGGMQPGAWNDGAYGYLTVDRKKPTRQYIHVTTRPATAAEVRIRDNGHRVRRITDLRTGERIAFDQRDGVLTLKGITAWDPYDTVFAVDTRPGREGLHPARSVKATATSAKEGFPASALSDGDFASFWDSAAQLPVSLTLDLGRVRKARFLALNQREWSPTYNRETFGRAEDSARIKDYRVSLSRDGVTWGEPVRSGVLESARGTRFIDLGDQRARYLKLEIDSTWAKETVPRFHRQLQIDEIRVGHGHPRARSRR